MDPLEAFLDILKYTIPAVIVFLAVYFVLKKYLDNQLKVQVVKGKQDQQGTVIPIRLQAYERMVLLLERITPNNLVMRVNNPNFTAGQLHQELLASIRAEFEHNLTQQVYISRGAWEAVRRSKEETVKLVNIAASKVNPNAKGLDLAKVILELSMEVEKLPTQAAIDFVKEEARSYF